MLVTPAAWQLSRRAQAWLTFDVRQNAHTMKEAIVFWMLVWVILPTFGFGAAPRTNIAGRYVGAYAGGTASFELLADGSYTTSFVVHQMSPVLKKTAEGFHATEGLTFSGKGNWTVSGEPNQPPQRNAYDLPFSAYPGHPLRHG